MGDTFQHYLSFTDAFPGKEAAFDAKPVKLLTDRFKEQASRTQDAG